MLLVKERCMKLCSKFNFVPIRAANEQFIEMYFSTHKHKVYTVSTSLLSACNFKCWLFFITATTFTALISFIINEWVWGGRVGVGGSIKISNIIAINIVLVNNTCHCKSRVRCFPICQAFTCCCIPTTKLFLLSQIGLESRRR